MSASPSKPRPASRRDSYAPRVILRRPLGRDDWRVAAGTGIAAAVATGLVTFYLTALWRARDPR